MIKWEERLWDFAEERSLFFPGAKLVAAVSGGVDSMVLLDLLSRIGVQVIVAHANFGLRGAESDSDEEFVRQKAARYDLPFFTSRFDAKAYMAEHSCSVQEAARELRYGWLAELREEQKADAIATAHHKNDSVETLLLNLINGTGIQGLTGIPPKNGHVVRPLLFAFRQEILEYAQQAGIQWREDSSNASEKYRRNFIRHKLIPLLKEINPSVERTLAETTGRMEQVNRMYRMAIQRMKNELVHFDEALGCFKISLLEMAGRQVTPELFFELVREFDFHPDQAEAMLEACMNQPGKRFYSSTHEALIDRVFILVREREEAEDSQVYHIKEEDLFTDPVPFLSFDVKEPAPDPVEKDADLACLDYDRLKFPLTVRKWQPGDSFTPFGMKGKKKLSDLLTDLKLSLHEKEKVHVLLSGPDIAWVIGLRIGEVYRVGPATRKCLLVRKQEM